MSPRADRRIGIAAVSLVGAILIYFFVADVWLIDQAGRVDLVVYHDAVRALLDGQGLYQFNLVTAEGLSLPFTYPPFAALLLTPIAALNLHWAFAVWDTLQGLVALLVVWLTCDRATPRRWPRTGVATALLMGVGVLFLLSGPVVHDLLLGQISLIVIALVVVDFTAVPPRYRGILTGVAGAVKLLPLIYLPYFVITRQWRAAANLVAGFVAATGLAFLILPQQSIQYWTQLVIQTGRVGDLATLRNKSLLGMLARFDLTTPVQYGIWLAVAMVIGLLALWRAWQHHRRGEEYAAMLVMGLLSAIVNPITWNHHLIWLSLAVLYLALTRRPVWVGVAVALYLGLWGWTPWLDSTDLSPDWVQLPVAAIQLVMIALVGLGFPRLDRDALEASRI